ncbi:cell wall-binding repeat-containing protein [Peptostreptococcus faecalis]|uniref:cell wall-binding repeat-containing protein n=1 Tax=Peptostreptococcus faecalis TaxID=2045015 RepID=UPI000C79A13B|nr:cell wall-binding repeat-containing protein [Peptostreptococcus faecalis]
MKRGFLKAAVVSLVLGTMFVSTDINAESYNIRMDEGKVYNNEKLVVDYTGEIFSQRIENGKVYINDKLVYDADSDNIGSTDSSNISRISGEDRYETNLKSINNNFKKSDYAVVVSGEGYADALSASPYAKKINAPLFFLNKNSVSDKIITTMKSLGVKNIEIIGGNNSISNIQENIIKSKLGVNINRITGSDRYETSKNIYSKMGDSTSAIVVSGQDFPDALSSVSLAAELNAPIVLNNEENIRNINSNNSLENVYIVGGERSVPSISIESKKNSERISGVDRYETSMKIYEKVRGNKNILVSGKVFPDSLSAVNLMQNNADKWNLLLTNKDSINKNTKELVEKNTTIILGGTESISKTLFNK